MNILKTYIFCLSAFLLTFGEQCFASNLDVDPEGTRTITIHLKNDSPGADLRSDRNIQIRGELGPADQAPYVLAIKDPAEVVVNVAYNIQVVLSVLGENNYSQVLVSDFLRTNIPMTWVFKVPNSVILDRARIDIDAIGAGAIYIKEGQVKPDGDFRFITLSSCWHSLKKGTTGWLKDDTLYAHFNCNQLRANTYKVFIGHGVNYFK
jgi:hypothetical protein